jgi:hypothetical protein
MASVFLANRWSWAIAGALLVVVLGLVLLAARPIVFIALALLPFVVLEETADALPVTGQFVDLIYDTSAIGLTLTDGLVGLCVVAALVWLPPGKGAPDRILGPTAWIVALVAGAILFGLVAGRFALDDPQGSMGALRPLVHAVAVAYVVRRLLLARPANAERLVLRGALAAGLLMLAIGLVRVSGVYGAASDIFGIPLTYLDATSPYILLACVGVWGASAFDASHGLKARVMLGALAAIGLVAAVASQRRGVILGFLVASAVLLAVNAFRRRGGLLRTVRTLVVIGAVAFLAVLGVNSLVPGAQQLFAERAGSVVALSEGGSKDASVRFRVDESSAVAALVRENVWRGIGPTRALAPINYVHLPTSTNYIHNSYLMLPLRYGVWGILGVLILVFGLLGVVARRLWRDVPNLAWVAGAGILATLPAILTAAFLTHTVRWPIIFGALVGAFDALTTPRRSDEGDAPDAPVTA